MGSLFEKVQIMFNGGNQRLWVHGPAPGTSFFETLPQSGSIVADIRCGTIGIAAKDMKTLEIGDFNNYFVLCHYYPYNDAIGI